MDSNASLICLKSAWSFKHFMDVLYCRIINGICLLEGFVQIAEVANILGNSNDL